MSYELTERAWKVAEEVSCSCHLPSLPGIYARHSSASAYHVAAAHSANPSLQRPSARRQQDECIAWICEA